MTIYSLGEHQPDIDEGAYVAKSASIIGQLRLGADSSVWSQTVLQVYNESITIGKGGNV